MLNINPINHNTNVNFKSQRDFSQLYKEMEKITLTSEEKFKPKVKSSDIVNNIKSKCSAKMSSVTSKMKAKLQKLKKKMSDIWDDYDVILIPLLVWGGIGAFIFGFMKYLQPKHEDFPTYFSRSDFGKNDFLDDTNTKTDAFNQADVLENLYKQGDITLAEYKQEMQKVIDTYDVNAHMKLFAEIGIYPDESIDKNALKDQYYHDEYGNLVARIIGKYNYVNGDLILTPQNHDLTTNIDCSEVDNNINILKDKVSKIEADKTSVSSAALTNDSIVNAKADSLINLYQNKTISFEDFQKKYNELNQKD